MLGFVVHDRKTETGVLPKPGFFFVLASAFGKEREEHPNHHSIAGTIITSKGEGYSPVCESKRVTDLLS